MPERDRRELIALALRRDPSAVRQLVAVLSPVIERRVATALWRSSPGRDVRQEVADMSQEVFAALFSSDGKALRAWDPDRGMSLESFVGMLAQHQVVSILRNGKTSPWRDDPTDLDRLDAFQGPGEAPDATIGSRDQLARLLEGLRTRLSPRGLELFERLIVDEEPIDDVARASGMTRDALYQWRSRLLKQVREVATELQAGNVSDTAASTRKPQGVPHS